MISEFGVGEGQGLRNEAAELSWEEASYGSCLPHAFVNKYLQKDLLNIAVPIHIMATSVLYHQKNAWSGNHSTHSFEYLNMFMELKQKEKKRTKALHMREVR